MRSQTAASPAAPPATEVLFVCLSNVCRSPMAYAVAQTVVTRPGPHSATGSSPVAPVRFDAAGTHANDAAGVHIDSRAGSALLRRGYGVAPRRSRRVTLEDFERFDFVLAMDNAILAELRRLCPPKHVGKVRLFLDFAPGLEGTEVPDPYFGNGQGFERVLDLCEIGVRGLLGALAAGDPLARGPS